jgi:hypothetical protein
MWNCQEGEAWLDPDPNDVAAYEAEFRESYVGRPATDAAGPE